MHRVSGRWRLGLLLALITAFCWGVLPIALKIVLERMDAYTITWYRVAVAAAALGVVLRARCALPDVARIRRRTWVALLVAVIGLAGQWVLYVGSLNYTTPAVSQTVVQLSPLLLLLGGLVIYKERFSRLQWLGLGVLVGGLALFFNRRLPELLHVHMGLGLGVAMLVLSSLLWAVYGLLQKRLLTQMGSAQVLWLMYAGSVFLLLPFARVGGLRDLDGLGIALLGFCCVNTLVGYGAFAEALEHWEMSRVSAVIAIAPVITLVAVAATARAAPTLLEAERFSAATIAGALLVVAGSMLSAFGVKPPAAG